MSGPFKDLRALPDPRKVFEHGIRFMRAEEILRQKRDETSTEEMIMLSIPSNVMAAFTIEVYLKCLLSLEGKQTKDTHHLGPLFRRIDNKKKDRINEIWDKKQEENSHIYLIIEQQTGIRVPSNLQMVLNLVVSLSWICDTITKTPPKQSS